MKLKSFRRLITQDYDKENQKLIEQISSPINNAFNELYFTLNGRVSLRDNLFCTVKDLDVTVDTNGVPVVTTSFTLDKQGAVIGCHIIAAIAQTNSSLFPTSAPFASFIQNGDSVIIPHISGLQAGQRYLVRIVAFLG